MSWVTSNSGTTKTSSGTETMDNIGIHFDDDLSTDTLSDYTLGGNTNPTYDSTENAIKLYDNTDADGKISSACQAINGPQDNIVWKTNVKIGNNDTSTDTNQFLFILRSSSDVDTYLKIQHFISLNRLYLTYIVGGAVKGFSYGTWNPSADTWYELKVIANMTGTMYLFVDDVELTSTTCTMLKRFYDSEVYYRTTHNAGEVSEVYVKDILVEDAPTVNAPRSNPPGLLTSAIRPAVEGTYWSDLAGEWSSGCSVTTTDALYGNGMVDSGVADNGYVEYTFDTAKDISGATHLSLCLAGSNAGDHSVGVEDSSGNESLGTTTLTASKMTLITESLTDLTGTASLTDIKKIIIKNESGGASDITVSAVRLIGGPEYHIMGQPSYKSPWADGIDDTPEATLGGDTAPAFDTDRIDFDETTNADNQTSEWSRSLNFNPNGVGQIVFSPEILATDTGTDLYWQKEIRIDDNNRLLCYWEHNAGTPRIVTSLISGGTTNYTATVNTAQDNNNEEIIVTFHKDYGIEITRNGEEIASDFVINGTWTDWTSNPDLKFWTRHDAGEESHVKLHSVEFNRHPLNVHQYQSNDFETLTDTLAPSGTDYMDGDWDGGFSVQSTGNPITNGAYVEDSAVADAGVTGYSLDSGADLRRFDRTRLWIKGSNAGNHYIRLQSSSGNYRDSAAYSLTANTWTLVDLEDIIDVSWGSSGAGTLDPADVNYIAVRNGSGGVSNVSIYGLQFLSSEYDTEDFVPQDLVLDSSGSFSMASGEKMRAYKMILDGDITLNGTSIDFLDDFIDYGYYGDPASLDLDMTGETVSIQENVNMTGNLTITNGTFRVSDDTYTLTVGGNLICNGILGHSIWTGALSVAGDISGTGTYLHGNQTTTFNGQNKSISGTWSFYNLTIANSGFTINSDGNVTVTNTYDPQYYVTNLGTLNIPGHVVVTETTTLTTMTMRTQTFTTQTMKRGI